MCIFSLCRLFINQHTHFYAILLRSLQLSIHFSIKH
nr:MAG TPA: hypothetical protein [Caudoviricetes sp.]DAH57084.1 MAG TPA: hypothetical protein [Caudoviricetes sp.]